MNVTVTHEEERGPSGWKWAHCGEIDVPNFYFTECDGPANWEGRETPDGASIHSVQAYDGYVYCVGAANGGYFRRPLDGSGDWHDLGGDGGTTIACGDGAMFAWCDCDPEKIYRTDCGPDVDANNWDGFDLPDGGGLRSSSIAGGNLYVVVGNGNYFRMSARGGDWQQLAGDGGSIIACGDGKIWAWCDCDPDKLYHSDLNEGGDLEWGSCENDMNVKSMSIHNGKLHVIGREEGRYFSKSVWDGEWFEHNGDGGNIHAVGC